MLRGKKVSVSGVLRGLKTVARVLDPVQEASLSEKCILVNESDEVVGSASKRDCHRVGPDGSLLLHRAFSVFLFNSSKELLLQQRSASKITFPGCLTNTCCSHPLDDIHQERIEEGALGIKLAAIRRLHHELGIPVNELHPHDLHYITRILYKSLGDGIWGEYEVDYILFLIKDVSLRPNADEVRDVVYVPQAALPSFLSSVRSPLTPWFQLITQHYLDHWWSNLDHIHKLHDHNNIHKFS